MRMELIAQRFYQNAALFSCPLCRSCISPAPPASLRCACGHCFNLSSKGYVSFASQLKPSKYDKSLFESRRAVFDSGFYRPVEDALCDMIVSCAPPNPVIADIGCGDGHYSLTLKNRIPGTYAALDLSREAVALGARGGNEILWCVGDLARLPLREKCVDILLDILTPSNYGEFLRVLTPNGRLIKVIPGPRYLIEIRTLLGDKLRTQSYDESRVRDYLADHMHIDLEKHVTYTLPLSQEVGRHFIRMTPMTLGVHPLSLDLSALREITIDLILLCARAACH